MKPTYGRVSRYGVIAYASSLDQVGPFARDVADAALVLEAIAGHDPRDSTSSPRPVPLRVSAARRRRARPPPRPADASTSSRACSPTVERGGARAAIAMLEALGAIVEPVVAAAHRVRGRDVLPASRPPRRRRTSRATTASRYGLRVAAAAARLVDMYAETRDAGFGTEVKRRIMLGTYALSAGYYDAYYLKAQQVRTLIRRDFDAASRALRRASSRRSRRRPPSASARSTDDPLTDVPLRHPHDLGEPGRPARRIVGALRLRRRGAADRLQLIGRPFDEATLLPPRPPPTRRRPTGIARSPIAMTATRDMEAVIGLEVHAELLTRSKIFCGCSAAFGARAEHERLPGLPRHAGRAAGAEPPRRRVRDPRRARHRTARSRPRRVFARKNYFYPGSPKGYQISQYELPICDERLDRHRGRRRARSASASRASTWRRTPARTSTTRTVDAQPRRLQPLRRAAPRDRERARHADGRPRPAPTSARCARSSSTSRSATATWRKGASAATPTSRCVRRARRRLRHQGRDQEHELVPRRRARDRLRDRAPEQRARRRRDARPGDPPLGSPTARRRARCAARSRRTTTATSRSPTC